MPAADVSLFKVTAWKQCPVILAVNKSVLNLLPGTDSIGPNMFLFFYVPSPLLDIYIEITIILPTYLSSRSPPMLDYFIDGDVIHC